MMVNDYEKYSRVNKYEKRRKNTKSISILMSTGAILVVVLIGIWLFGGGEDEAEKNSEENKSADIKITDEEQTNKDESESEQANTDQSDGDNETDETSEQNAANQNVEKEQVEPSDDNVIEAYVADWEPIGTEQEGPHTTVFETDSLDWKEMEKAASIATEISEEEMHTIWIENGGDQKAIATVSDATNSQFYRVYISWVDGQGWQPTKVEVLKENDKT
ncbi:YrrS family protein [Virgibacillus sp. MG-45]|uniref:YrrS family protein n=1 Tax=Virgibacillus sp. MG-45 TaxID=3102791 RepID=UPI002ED93EDE